MESLMDFPAEIIQLIIYSIVDTGHPNSVVHLRGVNKYFEHEITKRFLVRRVPSMGRAKVGKFPAAFKGKLVLHFLRLPNHSFPYWQHMQHVATDMLALIKEHPTPDTAHVRSRDDILSAIATATVKYGCKRAKYAKPMCVLSRHCPLCYAVANVANVVIDNVSPQISRQDIRRSSCMIGVILDWQSYVGALLERDPLLGYGDWRSIFFGRLFVTAIRTRCTKVMRLFLEREMKVLEDDEESSDEFVLMETAIAGNIDVIEAMMPFMHKENYWSLNWGLVAAIAACGGHWNILCLLVDRGLMHRHGGPPHEYLLQNISGMIVREAVKRSGEWDVLAVFKKVDRMPILLPFR